MTPQDQEFLHLPEEGSIGDCLRACVATVLDFEREYVPHFVVVGIKAGDKDREEDPGMKWWEALVKWLALHGLECWWIEDLELVEYSKLNHLLVSGKAERPNGIFQHVCVAELDGHIVHDPNPARSKLISVDGYFLFAELGTWKSISE